jgi:TctA family transporter
MMDLRTPSGIFFLLIGLMVAGTGIAAPEAHARMTEVNVNLYSGLSMAAFGSFLLALAWRARRRRP